MTTTTTSVNTSRRYYPPSEDEKSYADCHNELTSDEVFQGLLAHGLFSEQMPPIFDASDFYIYTSTIEQFWPHKDWRHVRYQAVRNTGKDRSLGIPCPFPYFELCKCISTYWLDLQKHFEAKTSNQEHKVSRIHIRRLKDRLAIFEMNYTNWKTDGTPEPDIRIGKAWVAESDISKCFPSIYTHTISWALFDRDTAKDNASDHTWWPNILDQAVRRVRNGQTDGILIGPHASNLVAEIILVAVDKELSDSGFQFVRNIDDYRCFTETESRANEFQEALHDALEQFSLGVNTSKKTVKKLPEETVKSWVRKLADFPLVGEGGFTNYKIVRSYLDLAVDLMFENGDNLATIKYALKVLSRKTLSNNARTYVEQQMLHLASIYPYIIPLLGSLVVSPYISDLGAFAKWCRVEYFHCLQSRNYEGAAYILYFSLEFEFDIDMGSAEEIIKTMDPLLLLLGFLRAKQSRNKMAVNTLKDFADRIVQEETKFEENWIFAYHACRGNKLAGPWKHLRSKRISFLSSQYRDLAWK